MAATAGTSLMVPAASAQARTMVLTDLLTVDLPSAPALAPATWPAYANHSCHAVGPHARIIDINNATHAQCAAACAAKGCLCFDMLARQGQGLGGSTGSCRGTIDGVLRTSPDRTVRAHSPLSRVQNSITLVVPVYYSVRVMTTSTRAPSSGCRRCYTQRSSCSARSARLHSTSLRVASKRSLSIAQGFLLPSGLREYVHAESHAESWVG